MKIKNLIVVVISILLLSCSSDNNNRNDESLDMNEVEISREGMLSVVNYFEKNTEYKFNGLIQDVNLVSKTDFTNLRSSIDNENIILIEVLSNNDELINIYSSFSSDRQNEVIVFAETNGIVSDEVKFNFIDNNDGSVSFESSEIISNSTERAMSWFSCMQGFFSDPVVGTMTQTLGVASGVGCAACGLAAGFLTGVAALGCLG